MFCEGCICHTCANNLYSTRSNASEAVEPCYTCEECRVFDNKNRWPQRRYECKTYRQNEYTTEKRRSEFVILASNKQVK